MKNLILLSFLVLIFACSDDDDYPAISTNPLIDNTSPSDSSFQLEFSSDNSNSEVSCPDYLDAFYLIANNSFVSGEIENLGRIDVSQANTVQVTNCYPRANDVYQSFSGEFTTVDGRTYNFSGSANINTTSMSLNGSIIVSSENYDYHSIFKVTGIIHGAGLIRITGSQSAS